MTACFRPLPLPPPSSTSGSDPAVDSGVTASARLRRRGWHAGSVQRALVIAVVIGWGVVGSGAAKAQSLAQVYLAAQGYDANYLAARNNLEAARYRYDQARGLRLPSVGLGITVARQVDNTPNSPSSTEINTSAANATLQASQTLYNRANDATIAQSERAFDSFRFDLESAEQDLILRVSQAYFDVLAAQDNVATATASMAAIEELVASAKRNFEVGTATITDTREAQARFDLARFTLIQAQNDLTTRRILLDQTVGQPNVVPKLLAVPLKFAPVDPPNVEDWVARAESEHPQIQRARSALDIARLETEKARAGNLPTVTLDGSYQRGGSRNTIGLTGGGGYRYNTPNQTSTIAVNLNLPLFAGFQVQNRIKETLVLEDRSTNDLDGARRSVVQLTRQLFYQVGSATAQVVALEAAESSSLLALDATRLGFKVGVRVNIDVLNAQAQLYTTQAQLLRARYDRILAGLRLRQASGRLTPDDVFSVNRLLVP